jgi:hypothetical protein
VRAEGPSAGPSSAGMVGCFVPTSKLQPPSCGVALDAAPPPPAPAPHLPARLSLPGFQWIVVFD